MSRGKSSVLLPKQHQDCVRAKFNNGKGTCVVPSANVDSLCVNGVDDTGSGSPLNAGNDGMGNHNNTVSDPTRPADTIPTQVADWNSGADEHANHNH